MLIERGKERTGASFPHLTKPFTPDRLIAAVETLLAPGDEVVGEAAAAPVLAVIGPLIRGGCKEGGSR